ncbi:hypothetical protein BC940DRAFT_339019 [Gongronella butleri]|nr:hypothetical protein BC940DRAFT_339019 [Gongronella butleri]
MRPSLCCKLSVRAPSAVLGVPRVYAPRRRFFASDASAPVAAAVGELDAVHAGHHYAKIPGRELLSLEGPDALKFLQGLVTNNMPAIASGGDGLYTAFLTPQGRMLYDVFVYPVNVGENFPHPRFILDYGASDTTSLLKHLKRYILRAKIKIQPATDQFDLYHVWGKTHAAAHASNIPVGGLIKKEQRLTDIGCIDPRVPGFGYRAVVPKDQGKALYNGTNAARQSCLEFFFFHLDIGSIVSSDYSELPASEYSIRRILHGVPEGIDDIWPEQALPLECNLDYMNGVDFRKGCYVGQELTIRTYHTGVVRKRVVPVQIYKDGDAVPQELQVDRSMDLSLAPQSDIKPADGSSKRAVGKTGSSVHNVGLALMRLEQVQKCVQGEPLPLKVNGTDMLVRPFLPSWWPIEQEEGDA